MDGKALKDSHSSSVNPIQRPLVPWNKLAESLRSNEEPHYVFYCKYEGRPAGGLVTDTRVIVAVGGMLGSVLKKGTTVPVDSISEIRTESSGVVIRGSGAEIVLTTIAKPNRVVDAIDASRAG